MLQGNYCFSLRLKKARAGWERLPPLPVSWKWARAATPPPSQPQAWQGCCRSPLFLRAACQMRQRGPGRAAACREDGAGLQQLYVKGSNPRRRP